MAENELLGVASFLTVFINKDGVLRVDTFELANKNAESDSNSWRLDLQEILIFRGDERVPRNSRERHISLEV